MTSPQKFAGGFLLGLGGALALYYTAFQLQLGIPTQSSEWCWELNTKKQRIAAATGSPKLLLVGGSATLFGLSARDLSDQTGVPAVNMGTHAALGVEYLLHLAKKAAQRGDTVLLALEYEFFAGSFPDELFFDYVLARDPDYFRAWPWLERLKTAMYLSSGRLQRGLQNRGKIIHAKRQFPYDAQYTNEFGDQEGAKAGLRPPGEPHRTRNRTLLGGLLSDSKGFQIVAEFVSWANSHGIRVLATFPPICPCPEYESETTQEAFRTIERFYASLDVPVLGTPQEAMLEPDEFFDTHYHLTEEGARERTRRLLAHLGPFVAKQGIRAGSRSANPAH